MLARLRDWWGWLVFWHLGGRERERRIAEREAFLVEQARKAMVQYYRRTYGEKYWEHPDLTHEKAVQTRLAFEASFGVRP